MPLTAPRAATRNSSLCSLPYYHHSHVNVGALTPAASHNARSVWQGELTREAHCTSVTRSASTSTSMSEPSMTMGHSCPMPTTSLRHLGDGSPRADDNARCPPRSACRTMHALSPRHPHPCRHQRLHPPDNHCDGHARYPCPRQGRSGLLCHPHCRLH